MNMPQYPQQPMQQGYAQPQAAPMQQGYPQQQMAPQQGYPQQQPQQMPQMQQAASQMMMELAQSDVRAPTNREKPADGQYVVAIKESEFKPSKKNIGRYMLTIGYTVTEGTVQQCIGRDFSFVYSDLSNLYTIQDVMDLAKMLFGKDNVIAWSSQGWQPNDAAAAVAQALPGKHCKLTVSRRQKENQTYEEAFARHFFSDFSDQPFSANLQPSAVPQQPPSPAPQMSQGAMPQTGAPGIGNGQMPPAMQPQPGAQMPSVPPVPGGGAPAFTPQPGGAPAGPPGPAPQQQMPQQQAAPAQPQYPAGAPQPGMQNPAGPAQPQQPAAPAQMGAPFPGQQPGQQMAQLPAVPQQQQAVPQQPPFPTGG